MKKILLILILLTGVSTLFAQTVDVLYLNNGTVIRGVVMEAKENGSIVFKAENGNTYEYSGFDIRDIKQEVITKERRNRGPKQYTAFEFKPRGYFFTAELSAAATIEYRRTAGFPIQLGVINGYRVCEFFSIGAGVGVRYYARAGHLREEKTDWGFPLYGNLRGNFVSHMGRNLVPYWSLDAGYTIKDDGAFFSPTVGMSFGGDRNNFLVGFFYQIQNLKEPGGRGYWLDALGVKIGFQF